MRRFPAGSSDLAADLREQFRKFLHEMFAYVTVECDCVNAILKRLKRSQV